MRRRRTRRKFHYIDLLIPSLLVGASLLIVADFALSTSDQSSSPPRLTSKELALPRFFAHFNDRDALNRIGNLDELNTSGFQMAVGGDKSSDDFSRISEDAPEGDARPSRRKSNFSANNDKTSYPVRITSQFGFRRLHGTSAHHDGIDIGYPLGAPIRAAWNGTVTHSGWRGGYGNAVIIDHGNGRETLYAHASRLLVKPGQKVSAGDVIARVGNTGRSYGAHLHFELRVSGTPINPERYFLASKAAR